MSSGILIESSLVAIEYSGPVKNTHSPKYQIIQQDKCEVVVLLSDDDDSSTGLPPTPPKIEVEDGEIIVEDSKIIEKPFIAAESWTRENSTCTELKSENNFADIHSPIKPPKWRAREPAPYLTDTPHNCWSNHTVSESRQLSMKRSQLWSTRVNKLHLSYLYQTCATRLFFRGEKNHLNAVSICCPLVYSYSNIISPRTASESVLLPWRLHPQVVINLLDYMHGFKLVAAPNDMQEPLCIAAYYFQLDELILKLKQFYFISIPNQRKLKTSAATLPPPKYLPSTQLIHEISQLPY